MWRYILPISIWLTGCAHFSTGGFPQTIDKEASKQQNNQTRSMLIGQWCGIKKYPDGAIQKWLVKRSLDGRFQIAFDNIEADGQIKKWIEFGYWGVRYPIYFTHVVGFYEAGEHYKADKTNPELYEAYQILDVSELTFSYKSYRSGNEFTLNRSCSDWN